MAGRQREFPSDCHVVDLPPSTIPLTARPTAREFAPCLAACGQALDIDRAVPLRLLKRIKSLKPSHIILSGQSHPWNQYSAQSLACVFEVIKKLNNQSWASAADTKQMALAFGAPVDLMARLEPGEGTQARNAS